MGSASADGHQREDGLRGRHRGLPPQATLGTRLRRARLGCGLTQQRFARAVVDAGARAGVRLTLSASAVSRWEADTFSPALRYRRFVAVALAADEVDLFGPPAVP